MRIASSTARRLSTGSAPGYPRQTGQTFVFGGAPNAVAQPQKIFVCVSRRAWTSRPMTVSHMEADYRVVRRSRPTGFLLRPAPRPLRPIMPRVSRTAFFRGFKIAIVAVALALLIFAVMTRPAAETRTALVFAALVLIATFLRIDAGDASVGFEAAVVFGALLIFHSPAVALVAVLIGSGAHALYDALTRRKWRAGAVLQRRPARAVVLDRRTAVRCRRRRGRASLREDGRRHTPPRRLRRHPPALRLAAPVRRGGDAGRSISGACCRSRPGPCCSSRPIVAIEVMLYANWGIAGFAIAFLPGPHHRVRDAQRGRVRAAERRAPAAQPGAGHPHRELHADPLRGDRSRDAAAADVAAVEAREDEGLRGCDVGAESRRPAARSTASASACPTDQDILRWVEVAPGSRSRRPAALSSSRATCASSRSRADTRSRC